MDKSNSTVETIKTRVEANSPQAETKLTIVWDDVKAERAFASRGVRIAAQAMLRASGSIPADLEVKVSELAKRERGGFAMKPTPQNAMRLLSKLDDAQIAEHLANIGVSASDAKRMIVGIRAKSAPAPLVGVEAKRAAKVPSVVAATRPTAKK